MDMDILLDIFVTDSILENFPKNTQNSIHIKRRLGIGSYGSVFDIGNNMVIKIFFHSCVNKTIFDEKKCIIPYKNENRELVLYLKMIQDSSEEHKKHHIIYPLFIGYTLNKFIYDDDMEFKEKTYFVVLPLCIPFYKFYKIRDIPLIDIDLGYKFVIEYAYKLLLASHYIENKYKIINLDLKMSNIMYLKLNSEERKVFDLNESFKNKFHNLLLTLDFSIIKHHYDSNTLFIVEEFIHNNDSYYLWPHNNDQFKIIHIPSYSVAINVIELLLGLTISHKLPNIELLNNCLEKIKIKFNDIYEFLNKCLIQRSTTYESLQFITHLFNNLQN